MQADDAEQRRVRLLARPVGEEKASAGRRRRAQPPGDGIEHPIIATRRRLEEFMSMLKHVLAAAALTATVLGAGTQAFAADYPNGTIRVVHTSSAGAPIDVMMRNLAEEMRAISGATVVVEPRPGGSGQVAIAYMMGQPADGHTIHVNATGVTSVSMLEGASYKWEDLMPLYRVQLDPFALYVRRDGDFETLDQLIAAMREDGESIRIGGYGTGSPHQLAAIAMAESEGVDLRWVPYNSGSDAVADVMSGDLEAAMSNIAIYGRFAERTRVVAHTAEERIEALPDLPTFREQGIDLARYHWRGMLLRGDTPEEIADAAFELVQQAVQSEGFQQYLKDTSTLDGSMSRQAFADLLVEQAENDRRVLGALGMLAPGR